MQTPWTASNARNSSGGALRLLRRIPTKHLLIVGGLLIWGITIVIHRAITKPASAQKEAPQQQATSSPAQAAPQLEQNSTPVGREDQAGMPQTAPDPNLTLAEETTRQANAEFQRHWTLVNDKTLFVYSAKDGTRYEVARMTINPHFYPISEADKLNGIEMQARYLYSPTVFRFTKDGQITDWLSGDPGYIALHPMAPKPPTTIVLVEKKNGRWSANATLPTPINANSEGPTLDDVVERIRRGPVP